MDLGSVGIGVIQLGLSSALVVVAQEKSLRRKQPPPHNLRHRRQSIVTDPLAINRGHVVRSWSVPHHVIDGHLVAAFPAYRLE